MINAASSHPIILKLAIMPREPLMPKLFDHTRLLSLNHSKTIGDELNASHDPELKVKTFKIIKNTMNFD